MFFTAISKTGSRNAPANRFCLPQHNPTANASQDADQAQLVRFALP